MKQNMGGADRIIRVIIAAVIGTLFITNAISGVLAIILLAVAGIFLLTSLVGFCPLYSIFGLRTGPYKK